MENLKLKVLFPRLYLVSLDQGKVLGEMGVWENNGWSWRLRWRRPRFTWESAMEEELLSLIIRKTLRKDRNDVLMWNGEQDGEFSVKSAYSILSSVANNEVQAIFPALWQAIAAPKALCTAWRVLIERLPTYDNLLRRGLAVSSSRCVFCKETQETSQHFFIECAYAQKVWSLCLRWFGITFVQHKDISIHFESFFLPHLSVKQNQIWKGVWVAIVRSMWDQRNLVVFKQGTADVEEIVHLAQLSVWLKLKFGTNSFTYAFSDWVLNPGVCMQSC